MSSWSPAPGPVSAAAAARGRMRLLRLVGVAALALAAARCAEDSEQESLGPVLTVVPGVAELQVGESTQLSVAGATTAVSWSSSDPSVATVEFGRVTAVGAGRAVVVAGSGSESARASVTVVRPPTLVVSPSAAAFEATVGGGLPVAQALAITNGGDRPITGLAVGTIAYAGGTTPWLTAVGSATTAPATLTLRPNSTALPAGTYTATVPLTSSTAVNAPLAVTVTYQLQAAASVGLGATSRTFEARQPAVDPPSQTVAITNAGGGALSGLTASVSYAGTPGWLSATLDATTAPANLRLAVTTGTIAPGTYTATVTIGSAQASTGTVAVTFTRRATLRYDVFPIFSKPTSRGLTCASAGCHLPVGGVPPNYADYNTTFTGLVDVASFGCTGLDRVEPGLPESSCLYRKLAGGFGIGHAGGTIPASSDVQTIYTWILQGALREP